MSRPANIPFWEWYLFRHWWALTDGERWSKWYQYNFTEIWFAIAALYFMVAAFAMVFAIAG